MLQRSHDVPVLRRKKFNTCMNLENRFYIFIICKTGPSLLNKGNAHLKIASYRIALSYKERWDAICRNCDALYSLRLACVMSSEFLIAPSCTSFLHGATRGAYGMRDREFYAFRWRGDAGLPIICISGVYSARAKKFRRWGTRTFATCRTLSLYFARTRESRTCRKLRISVVTIPTIHESIRTSVMLYTQDVHENVGNHIL